MHLFSILLALAATEVTAPGSSSFPSSEAANVPDQSTSSAPVSAAPEAARSVSEQATAGTQASADKDRWYSLYRGKKLGLQLDAGAPDGAGLLVLFRPFRWLRVNGGLAYNYLGVGVRGGFSLVPVHWEVTPTLNFDLGHYFSGGLTKFVTPANEGERALYSDAADDYWSAQVGLEFGSQDGFAFYLRGGITHLSATTSAQNLTRYLNAAASSQYIARRDLDFTALLPSVRLGILIYVL